MMHEPPDLSYRHYWCINKGATQKTCSKVTHMVALAFFKTPLTCQTTLPILRISSP